MTKVSTYQIIASETRECDRGTLYNFRHGLDLNFLESERWYLFWQKTWWEGRVNPETPLVWYDKRVKLYVMPDRHESRTDLGSVPPPTQGWFPPTEAPYAYYMHDSGYRYHGFWVCESLNGVWRFQRFSRYDVDEICLSAMLEAGGMADCRRKTIYGTVWTFGWSQWSDYKPGKAKKS